MLNFSPEKQEYLLNICALVKDQDDNLVFVGMTLNDSIWYAQYLEQSFYALSSRTDDNESRYLLLQKQHEQARCSLLAADSLLQFPSSH